MNYGCYNKPRPKQDVPTFAQNGWEFSHNGIHLTRVPVMVRIEYKNTVDCQYTLTTDDRRCDGCKHKATRQQ